VSLQRSAPYGFPDGIAVRGVVRFVAGSVALVAFGLDSAIEVVSATVVLVHLRAVLAGAEPNAARQRWALRIIAVTFFALAAYVRWTPY